MTRPKISGTGVLVFIVALATLHGPSMALLDNFDIDQCVDCQTYLGISNGDFNQSPVRRYRVIVPALSAIVDKLIPSMDRAGIIGSGEYNQSLLLSFYIVNNVIVALFGLIVFLICHHYSGSFLSSLVGMISVISCRWAFYAAALPLVDSLYLLAVSVTLLGIIKANRGLLIAAILIGPWAKESFLLFIPFIFFFGPDKKTVYILWILISGILVIVFRYIFDTLNGFQFMESLVSDTQHVSYIITSLKRLFSLHGLYEIFSVTGFWLVIIIIAMVEKQTRKKIFSVIPGYWYWFLLIILLHALLSTEIARMMYIASPFFLFS